MQRNFNRSIKIIFFLLISATYLVSAQEEQAAEGNPRMAVLPFIDTNESARQAGYGEAISGMLVTSIINDGLFRVVERSELDRIMNEQSFQLSGAVNPETAKKIGELYAVDYLLFGSVAKFGSGIETDIRLVDTETGEAILAEAASAQLESGVRSMVQDLVRKIVNRYRVKLQSTSEPLMPGSALQIQSTTIPSSSGTTEGMVLIPGGQFTMGSQAVSAPYNEKPPRTIFIDPFYLDVTEVTNSQYQKFMEATGQPKPKYWHDNRFNKPEFPVVGVSWEDAAKFAAWAGKRLPTEAEWEYAARGGEVNAKYPWGDEVSNSYAWFGKPFSGGTPTKVASYAPNGFGLYDMGGNVGEWCADWYSEDAYKDPANRNPTGPARTSMKSIRGGAYYEDAYYLRCTARKGMSPNTYSNAVGFRCAKSVQ